jgi:hypothetical protein
MLTLYGLLTPSLGASNLEVATKRLGVDDKMSWWTRIHEAPTFRDMSKQIQRLREIAVELGFKDLRGLSSWMRSQGLDYYDVLKEFSP